MEKLVKKLSDNKITVSTCESCTGGLLAAEFVNVSGASDVFLEGAVTYSNDAKMRLGVKKETLEKYGAVSEETALEMALAIKKRASTTLGISTTGIAGPGGGSAEKPVGLVYTAIVSDNAQNVYKLKLNGDRTAVRCQTVEFIIKKCLEINFI